MAFWSKEQPPKLTPEVVMPISHALSSVPHRVEWSRYDDKIDGEQVLFVGKHAKIHVWANYRDRLGTASIMELQTEPFAPSNEVVSLERLLDYNDEYWEDYRDCFGDQEKLMALYGQTIEKYAIPYLRGETSFELLVAFNRGFHCAYTGHFSRRFELRSHLFGGRQRYTL